MSRQMLPRNARVVAVRQLFGFAEESNELVEQIEEDDVRASANYEDENDNDGQEEEGIDEEIEEDENDDFIFHIDDDESEDNDNIFSHDADTETSKDGTGWSSSYSFAGRRPARNVLTQTPGFNRGLHPQSNKEAFLVIFDEIIDIVVSYTNLAIRRISRENGFTWRTTNREEIESFLGLHFLAGMYIVFDFQNDMS